MLLSFCPMKILIIDNEQLCAAHLCNLLKEYYPANQKVQIVSNSIDLNRLLQDQPTFDLIFLNALLAEKFAFDLLKEFLVECPLILLTNELNFVLKPSSPFYIDYLVKPLSELSLAKALLKLERFKSKLIVENISNSQALMSNTSKGYKSRFLIRLGSRMLFVNTSAIAYFYVTEKIVYLVNIDGARYPIDYSLDKIQQLVDPFKFFRVNRSVICSTQSIREIKTHLNSRLKIILSTGNYLDEVLVSREKVSNFIDWVEGEPSSQFS